ncbi:hypothetical protein [Nostoc favosum]|jgi:DNA-directed RNA polymerase beta subunit|uniref:Uncharacterized protein n=1 Tax=Nostoc favosum CHAB5714 TaxID=2780399 RepID=A0ABS8I9M7_9NOSO|nr:hypothetical protein [Nostoc favosum]MCC5600851.1 hypothetical protein [Nostoc favosum CHAB5714]
MARKSTDLTVPSTESASIEPQTRSIVRGKNEQTISVTTAFAVVLESLEIAFDDDLRLAIFERLVRDHKLIQSQASEELQIAQAMEQTRLEAMEKAREQGKQIARSQMAEKKKKQLALIQKQFIDVELSQLLDSCDYLGYEAMKQTVNTFANRVGVSLEWRDLEDGRFECIPYIA